MTEHHHINMANHNVAKTNWTLYKAKSLVLVRSINAYVAVNARLISFFASLFIVTGWTVFRHITNGINFDVVGQIGLAQQWSEGMVAGSQLGVTNYVLKMPIYFLVNGAGLLSPMGRLMVLALLFNILTFSFLFIIYEKILKLYNIRRRSWFYLSFAWLATIAGDVFWVDYANSRNLEVVGGLLLFFFWLKYIKKQSLQLLVLLLLTSSVVFFADNLMFYVCGLGVCIYATTNFLFQRNKHNLNILLSSTAVTLLGYTLSKVISKIVSGLFSITFYSAPHNAPDWSIAYLVNNVRQLASNTLDIFGANFLHQPIGPNNFRQTLNAFVLGAIIMFAAKLIKGIKNRAAIKLAITIIAVNFLVYLASGQVNQWATSRYLIMVPLMMVVIVGLGGNNIKKKLSKRLMTAWFIVIAINAVFVIGALVTNLPSRYQKDTGLYSLVSFMESQHYKFAISSRQNGVVATYLSDQKIKVLPFGCTDGKLLPTNLFYDNAVFGQLINYSGEVPIVLPAGEIKFGDYTCQRNDIVAQFGEPIREQNIEGVGRILIYSSDDLKIKELDKKMYINTEKKHSEIIRLARLTNLNKLQNCKSKIADVVVAHADDDILFMNPDINNGLRNGWCIRAIYITAGDNGRDNRYWEMREQGIKTAYAQMLNSPDNWNTHNEIINGKEVTNSTLQDNQSVSLVFLRLPDGGVHGNGFEQTGNTSIHGLSLDEKLSVTTVDGKSSYTYSEIMKTLSTILYKDQPSTILTTLYSGQLSVGDHSDHAAAGQLAISSAHLAASKAEVTPYVGYPSSNLPQNLDHEQAQLKKSIFTRYAKNDEAICGHENICAIESTYNSYFSRQYKIIHSANNQQNNRGKNVKQKLWLSELMNKTSIYQL